MNRRDFMKFLGVSTAGAVAGGSIIIKTAAEWGAALDLPSEAEAELSTPLWGGITGEEEASVSHIRGGQAALTLNNTEARVSRFDIAVTDSFMRVVRETDGSNEFAHLRKSVILSTTIPDSLLHDLRAETILEQGWMSFVLEPASLKGPSWALYGEALFESFGETDSIARAMEAKLMLRNVTAV